MGRINYVNNSPRVQDYSRPGSIGNDRFSKSSHQCRAEDLENESGDSTQFVSLRDCTMLLLGVAAGVLITMNADRIQSTIGSIKGRVSVPSMDEIKETVQKGWNCFASLFQEVFGNYQGNSYQGN